MASRVRAFKNLRVVAVIAAATVVLVSGCDDDAEDGQMSGASSTVSADAGSRGSVPSKPPAALSNPTGPEDTTEASTTSDDTSVSASPDSEEQPTGKDCLIGRWSLDNKEFSALMEGASKNTIDDIKGSVLLTFRADGTARTRYDDWSHTITVGSSRVTLVKDGVDTGTYAVTGDGTMTVTDTKIGSTTTSTMTINGQHVAAPVAKPEPSVFSQATFTCAGDALTASASGGKTVLHRQH